MTRSATTIDPRIILAKLKAGWSDVSIARMLDCTSDVIAAYRRKLAGDEDDVKSSRGVC